MATVVEHDKRKYEILQKAMDVFVREGYEDVTFQKIADRCGITRTTLYIYFKNKKEIFLYSIKQLTDSLEGDLVAIAKDEKLSTAEALKQMLYTVIDDCRKNEKLLKVLLPYLLSLQKTGENASEKVRRRILRLRHLMALLIIKGIKNKEFKYTNVKDANEMLFGLVEATIFRMVVYGQDDSYEMKNAISLSIEGILLKND